MIARSRLSRLPRGGTLHVMTGGDLGAWPTLAMAAAEIAPGSHYAQPISRILIGHHSDGEAASELGCPVDAVMTAPAGHVQWLARRVREWLVTSGSAPLMTVAWDAEAGRMVQEAIPHAERVVHASPPAWAAEASRRAASDYWRGVLPSDRAKQREALGIANEAFVVLCAGESPSAVDARKAFAIVGRAAFAGSDVVMIAPEGARHVAATRDYGRASRLERRLATIEGSHRPSPLWRAADLVLLLSGGDGESAPWRSDCAWWALAAGIPVLSDGCAPTAEGVVQVEVGDIDAAARAIMERAGATDSVLPYASMSRTTSPLTSVSL